MIIGWRKLTVGDRSWRIIWEARRMNLAARYGEITQVWAIGARSDSKSTMR